MVSSSTKTDQIPSVGKSVGKIAFIQSCWHKNIVDQGKLGFFEKAAELGVSAEQVDCFELPGAFEIPLKCKQVINSGEYSAVVTAGLVVDGGVYQHEFVAQAVISGLMQVQLETQIPVFSMVLTPQHFDESEERTEFFFEHFKIKGHELAETLHATLLLT